jgi:hypothetical protein
VVKVEPGLREQGLIADNHGTGLSDLAAGDFNPFRADSAASAALIAA